MGLALEIAVLSAGFVFSAWLVARAGRGLR